MKNWIIKFRDLGTGLIDETRFVFEFKNRPVPATGSALKVKPTATGEVADESAELDTDDLGSLSADLQSGLRAEAESALGEKLDLKDSGPEKLSDTMAKLIEAFTGSWDKIIAMAGALFGMKPSDVDEVVVNFFPSDEHTDNLELDNYTPTGKVELGTAEASKKDRARAIHAEEKLRQNPEWRGFIGRSAKKHGFPVALLTMFIEYESGFNPDSMPVYKDLSTGKKIRERWMPEEERAKYGLKLLTSAHGLAQAMYGAPKEYINSGRYQEFLDENGGLPHLPRNPDPEIMMYIPEIAIDFLGWHLGKTIADANSAVRKRGLPDNYLLSKTSDFQWLYMSYNNGGNGYSVLRNYTDNPTPENYAKLRDFQKKPRTIDGHATQSWETRANYAMRVAGGVNYFDSMPSTVAWNKSVHQT